VDREKAKTYGIPLGDVFDTMQVYLGSLYVNDFNRLQNISGECAGRIAVPVQPEEFSHLRQEIWPEK